MWDVQYFECIFTENTLGTVASLSVVRHPIGTGYVLSAYAFFFIKKLSVSPQDLISRAGNGARNGHEGTY